MKNIEQRQYQKEIIQKAISTNKNTLIQLPTGGGKTFIATEIIRHISDLFGDHKQVLFVAPKIVLMDQTLDAFQKAFRNNVILQPQKVHGTNKFDHKKRVLVSTIHTASRREHLNPDVIIVDEVHYGFDGKMLENLQKNNPNSRIIGLSATPYDQNGRKLEGFYYIDHIDIKYLMKHNFLVQKLRQYELVKPDLSNIRIVAGDYDQVQLGNVACDDKTILEIVNSTKEFILATKKTIVFAVNIAHAELLTEAYVKAGLSAKALHSKSRNDENDEPLEIQEEIDAFRIGKTKVLVSVLMLTTGFDVPDTDCAVIARPTKSQNLYKQMVGRILRKAPDKKEAILLDCGNVIRNLGMPLDPIRETTPQEADNTLKCKKCQSDDVVIKQQNKKFYKYCNHCGFEEEMISSSYKCEKCYALYGVDGDFEIQDNMLFLACECGHKTVISKYSDEQLIEIVIDDDIREDYKNYLISNFGNNIFTYKYVQKGLDKYENQLNKNKDFIKKLSNFELLKKFHRKLYFDDYIDFIKDSDIKQIISNHSCLNYIPSEVAYSKYALAYISSGKFWNTIERDFKLKDIEFRTFGKIDYIEFYLIVFLEVSIHFNQYNKDNIDKRLQYRILNTDKYQKLIQDFLNSSKLNNTDKLSFEEARKFARELNLKDESDWINHYDSCYPYYKTALEPKEIYKDKWISWADWLGLQPNKNKGAVHNVTIQKTNDIDTKNYNSIYLPFEEARDFVRNLKLDKLSDWDKYCSGIIRKEFVQECAKKNIYPSEVLPKYEVVPQNIPIEPEKIYLNSGWQDLHDWLGLDKGSKNYNKFLSYEEATNFIHSLNLKTKDEWQKYRKGQHSHLLKMPSNIPSNPKKIYKNKGWSNWNDWLGLVNPSQKKEYLSYDESKLFVKNLQLKSKRDWEHYIQHNNIPNDIPQDPQSVYQNRGWISYRDWLNFDEKDLDCNYKNEIETLISISKNNCNQTIDSHIQINQSKKEKLLKLRRNTVSKLIDLKIIYLSRKKAKDITNNTFIKFKEDLFEISESFQNELNNILNL